MLFDHFFPGVIPGDVLHVPEMEYSADSPVVKAIVAAILANPQKAVALASVDQIKLPYTTLGQLVLSIVRPIGYNIRGTNDLLARTGGQSPFGNVGVWYTRLEVVDPFVNAGVGRFAAQPGGLRFLSDYYQTRGTLAIPLLTLHTTLDPDVPNLPTGRRKIPQMMTKPATKIQPSTYPPAVVSPVRPQHVGWEERVAPKIWAGQLHS